MITILSRGDRQRVRWEPMQEEDDRPLRSAPQPISLATLSVADLERRIVELRAEIERVEAELVRRRDVRSAAEAMFRRGGRDEA